MVVSRYRNPHCASDGSIVSCWCEGRDREKFHFTLSAKRVRRGWWFETIRLIKLQIKDSDWGSYDSDSRQKSTCASMHKYPDRSHFQPPLCCYRRAIGISPCPSFPKFVAGIWKTQMADKIKFSGIVSNDRGPRWAHSESSNLANFFGRLLPYMYQDFSCILFRFNIGKLCALLWLKDMFESGQLNHLGILSVGASNLINNLSASQRAFRFVVP